MIERALLVRFERSLRARQLSERTIEDYRWGLDHLERHSGKIFTVDTSDLLLAPDMWNFLEDELVLAALSPASRKLILAGCKSWVRWGHSRDLWDLNGLVSIPSPSIETDPAPALDRTQVRWLIDRATTPRRKRLLVLGLHGCRIIESARMNDVCWLTDRLSFIGAKTRKRREIPITPALLCHRAEILSVPSTRRQLRWIYEQLRSESPFEWTTHSLRRTFAQWLLDAENPLEVVEDLMGHSTKSTTLKSYARVPWKLKVAAMSTVEQLTLW